MRINTSLQQSLLDRMIAAPASTPVFSFAYTYNAANQRVAVTNADATRWVYQYDTLGQVISGKRYWGDGSPMAGQQFEYVFDTIGNRPLCEDRRGKPRDKFYSHSFWERAEVRKIQFTPPPQGEGHG